MHHEKSDKQFLGSCFAKSKKFTFHAWGFNFCIFTGHENKKQLVPHHAKPLTSRPLLNSPCQMLCTMYHIVAT